jgi:hypothetical protein
MRFTKLTLILRGNCSEFAWKTDVLQVYQVHLLHEDEARFDLEPDHGLCNDIKISVSRPVSQIH